MWKVVQNRKKGTARREQDGSACWNFGPGFTVGESQRTASNVAVAQNKEKKMRGNEADRNMGQSARRIANK